MVRDGIAEVLVTYEQLLDRIVTDPAICHGPPCVRGHRVWVSLVVDLLSDGMTAEQILAQYPRSRGG